MSKARAEFVSTTEAYTKTLTSVYSRKANESAFYCGFNSISSSESPQTNLLFLKCSAALPIVNAFFIELQKSSELLREQQTNVRMLRLFANEEM